MQTFHSEQNLSLYRIETELLDLMRFRESVAEDAEMTPDEQKASLDAIDNQITIYVTREVAKVDGIAAYLRECKTRAAVLNAEAMRILDQATAWAARGDRLQAVTLRVMQQTGATQLDGANSTFKVKKNPPSVDVAQPELVPPEYVKFSITMTLALSKRLVEHLRKSEEGGRILGEFELTKRTATEPIKSQIASELKAGVGVPGCRLVDDKVRLVGE